MAKVRWASRAQIKSEQEVVGFAVDFVLLEGSLATITTKIGTELGFPA